MLYFITILFLVLNIYYKKSKILLFLDFLLLFILLGFSYGPYDTMIFINRFENYEQYIDFTEFLFNFIVEIGHGLNLNFRVFMIMTSLVELFLLFKFIKKNTKNSCYVIGLFIIYPMIIMFEQLRFFMAFTIIMVGAIDGIINKEKYYRIRAVIFICIASLIHSSSIFYLIFLLCDVMSTKKILIASLIMCILLSSLSFIAPMMQLMSSFVGEEKLDIVSSEVDRMEGNYGRSFGVLAMILTFYAQYLFMKKDEYFWNNLIENKDKDIINRILKMNILCLICIPLTIFVSPAFYRMPQSLMILNHIVSSKYITSYGLKIRKKEFIFILLNIFCTVLLLVLLVHTKEAADLIITPFFEENEFLKF